MSSALKFNIKTLCMNLENKSVTVLSEGRKGPVFRIFYFVTFPISIIVWNHLVKLALSNCDQGPFKGVVAVVARPPIELTKINF